MAGLANTYLFWNMIITENLDRIMANGEGSLTIQPGE
jgi:hypothetical protein